MLFATSLLGSLLGFIVCYRTIVRLHHVSQSFRMRVCMLNSMSLAFVFSMFVELATGSKVIAVILPLISVCVPLILSMKPLNVLDIIESGIASLMSISMSVMLIGMMDNQVIWVIQCLLLAIEVLLYLSVSYSVSPDAS
ncbi:hypothetical protein [Alicyclobacillus fastidiosus]|uniref:EamA domain-containing protein n=1 Tax=Alicyclobacillus fastidiosus TaxID=392011 RepID=A0ABV5AFX9_9BACL|nr:hypothetical protein [Alicyclobacillus fastidiosus]WEH11733.1 hypothetical protein PYS47_11240 [Alicyclobacillus fastidiosus]